MPAPGASAEPAQPSGRKRLGASRPLERPLRPGEVSLDELERAFRETATEVRRRSKPPARQPRAALAKEAKPGRRKSRLAMRKSPKATGSPTSRSASTWIRWNI